MNEQIRRITGYGIVPVVVIHDAEKAEGLAHALCAGGLPVAEVTFRTECAAEAIRRMVKGVPEILVGAGTVHSPEQAAAAVEAGAAFIVTPGFSRNTVQWCLDRGVPVFPGCTSPSDIEAAMSMGLDTVKFFPAEPYGGVKTLKALAGPYGGIRFMPTGGINEKNIAEYLALKNVAACGGSWMVPSSLVETGDFNRISALCREAVHCAFGFELLHVGINTENTEEARQTAAQFAGLFGLPVAEYPGSYFAGSMVEVIKGPFLGEHGHIAVQTGCIDRAVEYFTQRGIALNPETASRDASGRLISIYFKDFIGGFAVHLRRKD